jgi:glycerophosphoryl diester phosphodiesterase
MGLGVGSPKDASDSPAGDADRSGRTLFSMLVERGAPIALVASWYQLVVVFVLTPAVSLCTWLAVTSTGGPAVVNATLLRLLVSPVSLGALTAGQVVAVAGSCLLTGACCIVALEGVTSPLSAIWRAVRRLPGLVAIVLWGLLYAIALSLMPLALAAATYAALWGTRPPAEVLASSQAALITLGVVLGVSLAVLWLYLYLRWLFAIPVCIAEQISAREALARSWKLTKRRWFGVGFRIARTQLLVAIVGGIALAIMNSAAIQMAGAGVSAGLVGAIALYSAGAVALNVALSVSFEAIRLSSYLAVAKRELPAAEGSTGGWTRHLPVALVLGVASATGIVGISGVSKELAEPVDFSHVEVIAHRAGATNAPENSLAAVALARRDGASRIEFDVRRTSDGLLVVVHDKTLRRVADKDIDIEDSTFAQIGLVDIGSQFSTAYAGEGVPPLGQFLDATGDTPLALEIKSGKADKQATRDVVKMLKARGDVGRTVVISLDPQLTALADSLDPELKIGDLIGVSEGRSYMLPADVVAPEYSLVNSQYVSDAHARGKKVWVWTVDDEDEVREAILRGVDGIITNDVPRARAVLESMSTHPPSVAEVTRQRVRDLIGG